MGSTKRIGRWLLYGICLAPAVIMLGLYWIEYIPSQREYFLNLRFRALSIIGDQFRAKIGSLAASLENATNSATPDQYIKALVPDLDYHGCARGSDLPPLEIGKAEDSVRFRSANGCVADASMSRTFYPFMQEDLFDDVVIALAAENSRVIYQRSASSPWLASLSELSKAPSDVKTASKEANGTDADAVRPVRLGDSEFLLLLQPVSVSAQSGKPVPLILGGLVRASRLAAESHHVPPKYLLVLFAPVLIILLSGPFLKILLLTRTGRLAFRDMALLGLFTLLAAGLVTIFMASWHQYLLGDAQTEPDLEKFAQSVNTQMASDVERMRSTLERFDSLFPANTGQIHDRTDLLASDLPAPFASAPVPFDFVFWTNSDGCQIAKWSTRRFTTERVDQKSQQHFQNVMAKRLWWSHGKPFTLQTLLSPTTSQLIVVLAIPSRHAGLPAKGCNQPAPSPIVSAAIVGSLPSVSAPLVPPGTGFAIFEPNGRVLFHSSSERNLHENLFEEINSPDRLRAGVTMQAAQWFATDYRGRQYQFYIQPVTGLGAIPWRIAVFRELEPRQAMIGLVWGETLILFVALLTLLLAVFGAAFVFLKAGFGWSWRRQVDFFLSRVWPDPARHRVFRRLAWTLGAIFLAALIVVTVGWLQGYRAIGWLLPFCSLLPLTAIAVAAFWLRQSHPAGGDILPAARKQPAYVASFSFLVMLLAVVPASGLFSVCQAYETRLYLAHWQRELLNSVEARRARITGDLESSQALSDQAKVFIRRHFLPLAATADGWDSEKYTANFWRTSVRGAPPAGAAPAIAWWQVLLTRIRPEAEVEATETGVLARAPAEASPCEWLTGISDPGDLILRCQTASIPAVTVQSTSPSATIPTDSFWWITAALLLGGLYAWNCLAFCRLFNLDFRYTPLLALTELQPPSKSAAYILVLGLPLARKDKSVCKWLGYTPPRVNLWEARFAGGWVEQTVERLTRELRATAGAAVQAATVPGGTVSSSAPAPVRPWIHISNLEAKLGDSEQRQIVANLLERLILMDLDGVRPSLIVTSTVDPVFHFDSVLSDERKKIYEHPLPEPELQRLARILHNFRKTQAAGVPQQKPEWAAKSATGRLIYQECRHHPAMLEDGEEVLRAAGSNHSREALLAMVAERMRALYLLFWASCTRSEKLLLVQLAQTGLVNPLCLDTLEVLVRKGLILPGPPPRIMSETFQRFLARVEGPETVQQWEREAGESSWLIIRNILLALLAVGLVVLALTQQPALQTATAVVTGVGTVLAGLFRVFSFFSSRRAPAAETPASTA